LSEKDGRGKEEGGKFSLSLTKLGVRRGRGCHVYSTCLRHHLGRRKKREKGTLDLE